MLLSTQVCWLVFVVAAVVLFPVDTLPPRCFRRMLCRRGALLCHQGCISGRWVVEVAEVGTDAWPSDGCFATEDASPAGWVVEVVEVETDAWPSVGSLCH